MQLLPAPMPAAGVGSAPLPRFPILTTEPGVHRLSFEALRDHGLAGDAPGAHLSLEHAGDPVPVHLEDGGDGRFGPGDALLFLARPAPSGAPRLRPGATGSAAAQPVSSRNCASSAACRRMRRAARPPGRGSVGQVAGRTASGSRSMG
ncbi:hypothetical protein HFP89_13670 [Wenzhouxiangella sp. XN79A]|uniref:hypothetical protein n=1 Tax=Wenzhouxiangella sp. XN79A TaxID=2724193 RepID=UPI00144A5DB4|nr:hypothetical protein [Wenzhouxiangella sp. XN79A]NKI36213.1 hypothetical protein [Wenzhouxiangella sp. XN79A]